MKTKLKKWKMIKSKKLFGSPYFDLFQDTVLLPNNKKYNYFLTNRRVKVVTVLSMNKQGEFLLSKEYRHPVKKVIYQSVGGRVEKGVSPFQTAKKELKEETGYLAKKMVLLGTFYSNPARSGAIFYAYLATDLRQGKAQPEQTEFIENEFLPKKRIESMIKSGEIKEPYFMAAYLLYKLKHKEYG